MRPSREALGCHSAFHKETKTLEFSQVLYKENIIFGAQGAEQREHEGERRRRGGLRQRSSRGLEINSSIISLICLVLFSLIIHGFYPSYEWLVYF